MGRSRWWITQRRLSTSLEVILEEEQLDSFLARMDRARAINRKLQSSAE